MRKPPVANRERGVWGASEASPPPDFLEEPAAQFPPNHLLAPSCLPITLSAPIWQAFTFETCFYLLHVPSSSILKVPQPIWQKVCEGGDFPEPLELRKPIPLNTPLVNITSIALNVAERCNLRCTYCYAGDGTYGNDSLMSFEIARRAIRFFSRAGQALHIVFFGGEPLLNFKLIKEVVEWCGRESLVFRFSLTTNGALLTNAHLEFFRAHDFALRISYDGKRLQAEQRTRNKRLADLIERKLETFRTRLLSLRQFHLRATIRRGSLEGFLGDSLQILSSHTYRLVAARVASLAESERFEVSDIQKWGVLLTRLVDELLKREEWEKLLLLGNLRRHLRNFAVGKSQPFCGAGINYLSVSTRGEFFLCHRFTEDREECAGSLENGLDGAYLQRIVEYRQGGREPCRSCWMRSFCQGGCFHEHKMASKKISTIDPLFCQLQDVEMKLALRIFVALKQKAPAHLQTLVSAP
ncbi:MAG: radical SAM protein [Deltaproteobacteria bacterium]|nr:radical SAM protein [Deltaproteobacteria bacterium]